MNTDPAIDPQDFSRLLQRWQDGLCTVDEADRFWQSVVNSAASRREFTAASRFEGLLESAMKERAREKEVAGFWVGVLEQTAQLPKEPVWQKPTVKRALRIAAVLAAGGLFWWIANFDTGSHSAPRAVAVKTPRDLPARTPAPSSPRQRSQVLPRPTPPTLATTEWDAAALNEWLSGYYLSGCEVQDLPLREALMNLHVQMMQLNFFGTDIQSRLRLVVTPEAGNRRVSLKTGPISFLKAVETLAALAGCQVELGDRLLTVKAIAQPYPQMPLPRSWSDVLAGKVDAEGNPEAAQPEKIALVQADAIEQGIVPAEPSADGRAWLTAAQVEALRRLAEARAQLAMQPQQKFQVRLTPQDRAEQERILTVEEVQQLQAQPAQPGTETVVTVQPGLPISPAGTADNSAQWQLVALPLGEGIEIGLQQLIPMTTPDRMIQMPSNGQVPSPQLALNTASFHDSTLVTGVIGAGQGVRLVASSLEAYSTGSSGTAMVNSSVASGGALTSSLSLSALLDYAAANNLQVNILPITNP